MQRVPPDVAYLHAVKSIKDTQADRVISPALSTNGRSVIATRTFLDSASTTGCVRLAPTHPVTSPLHTTNSVRSPPSVFGIPPDGHPAFGDTPFENAQAALLDSLTFLARRQDVDYSKFQEACQEFKIEARKINISLGRIAADKTVADQDDAASTRSSSILRANRTYGVSRADNNDDAVSTRSFATMRSVRASMDPAGDGTSTVACAWTRSGGGISTILNPIFVRYLASALQQGAKDHSGLLSPQFSCAQAMLMEGLARCLLDNPRTQDLVLRTQPSLIFGLGEVMRLKKLDAFGWVCMSLSQMAMRSPDAAIEIAKIKGLSHNVTSVLSERQAMNSVKDDCVLLVNNVAAIGGEEAIIALTSCEELLVTLLTLLCDAIKSDRPDTRLLQRITGCFTHITRSKSVGKNIAKTPSFKSALERTIKARGLTGMESVVALATMALNNMGIHEEDGGEGCVVSEDGFDYLARFLQCAMDNEKVYDISFRVYDVLFPIAQLANHKKNHELLTHSGILNLVVEIIKNWKPGLYAAHFSKERADTFPVLEMATEILTNLTNFHPAWQRMIDLSLPETCEFLIQEHRNKETIQTYISKVLWRLRDRESVVASMSSIIDVGEHIMGISNLYSWNDKTRKIRLLALLHDTALSKPVNTSLRWLERNFDVGRFLSVRHLLVGVDEKCLGVILHAIRRVCIKQKRFRLVNTLKRLQHQRATKYSTFWKWQQHVQVMKSLKFKHSGIIRKWMKQGLSKCFESWKSATQAEKFQRQVVLRKWKNQGLSRGFESWKTAWEELKYQRQVVNRIVTRWNNMPKSIAFITWYSNVQEARYGNQHLKQAAAKVIKRWRHMTLAPAFQRWYHEHLHQKHIKRVSAKLLLRWTHMALASAFARWKTACEELQHQRQVVNRIVTRWNNMPKSIAFITWYSNVQEARYGNQRLKQAAAKVIKRWRHMTLAPAFQRWYHELLYQRHTKLVISKILLRWTHMTLASAFARWKEELAHQKHVESVMSNILRRWMHGALGRAFERWQYDVFHQKRVETIMAKVLRRLTRAKMVGTFDLWLQFTVGQKVDKSKMRKAAKFFLKGVMASCFDRWRTAWANVSWMHLDTVQRLLCFSNRLTDQNNCWRVLKSWRTSVTAEQAQDGVQEQLVKRGLRRHARLKYFLVWKDYICKPLAWLQGVDDVIADPCVDIQLKLGLDFKAAGGKGTAQREAFENDVIQDICKASGLDAASFRIKQLSAGSVIVDLEIYADPSGEGPTPQNVALDLEKQASNPSSALRKGKITCHTLAITLQEVLSSPPSDQEEDAEKPVLRKTTPKVLRSAPKGTKSPRDATLTPRVAQWMAKNMDQDPYKTPRLTSQNASDTTSKRTVVRETKRELFMKLSAMHKRCELKEQECRALQLELEKFVGTGNGLVTWCSVGIELTPDTPHRVTGEVLIKDARGRLQHQPGYLNPLIQEDDELMSIDGMDVSTASLGMIKVALRGQIHTTTTLTFLRKNTSRRFLFDVRVLRLSANTDLRNTDTYFNLLSFQKKTAPGIVNKLPEPEGNGTPRPHWARSQFERSFNRDELKATPRMQIVPNATTAKNTIGRRVSRPQSTPLNSDFKHYFPDAHQLYGYSCSYDGDVVRECTVAPPHQSNRSSRDILPAFSPVLSTELLSTEPQTDHPHRSQYSWSQVLLAETDIDEDVLCSTGDIFVM